MCPRDSNASARCEGAVCQLAHEPRAPDLARMKKMQTDRIAQAVAACGTVHSNQSAWQRPDNRPSESEKFAAGW